MDDTDTEDEEDDQAEDAPADTSGKGKMPRTKNTNTAFIIFTGMRTTDAGRSHQETVDTINNAIHDEYTTIEHGAYLKITGLPMLINQVKCWSCVTVDPTTKEYVVYAMVSINHRIQVNFRQDSFCTALMRTWRSTGVRVGFPKTFRGKMETDIALYFEYLKSRRSKDTDAIAKKRVQELSATSTSSRRRPRLKEAKRDRARTQPPPALEAPPPAFPAPAQCSFATSSSSSSSDEIDSF